ncbi:phosphatase PAP2 family protein [Pseudopelagicola sp. nBUS_20]|uniref:phosphatase PAP2 family protein n=1 Tax=Pseudopelagicola sp. nBUS_20 TaxID=3395317 RepID=UPI003EBD72DE
MTRNRQALQNCAIVTTILGVVFVIFPDIDLFVSGLFHSEVTGFWIADVSLVNHLRETIWVLILLVFALALILLVRANVFGSSSHSLKNVWEVAVLTYLLGPALLVDAILKSYWGRARPSTIIEFGGTLEFSPAFVISTQCSTNCSFVSGEGSGATAFFITIILVMRNQTPSRFGQAIQYVAAIIASLGMVLRILMGRHFLSDTILAALFVTLITLGLLQFRRYRELRLF